MNGFDVKAKYLPDLAAMLTPRRRKLKVKPPPPQPFKGPHVRNSEEAECIAFNSYLGLLHPHCEFVYTFSGNGGMRDKVTAANLKRCGLTAGVWDYYFRAPGLPTLWIEMKFGKNGTTTTQEKWREALEGEGDIFEVCYTAEAALKTLVDHGYVPPSMVFFGPTAVAIRLQPPHYM